VRGTRLERAPLGGALSLALTVTPAGTLEGTTGNGPGFGIELGGGV
jgi:hypothetical protein